MLVKNAQKLCAALALGMTMAMGVSLNVSKAQAFSLINDNQIVPTSDLTENFNDFFLEEIADGSTANFNGFSSGSATGTITLDLIGNYDLRSFILWNDIGVFAEGIENFRLDFFTSSDSLIQSSNLFVGPRGQFQGEEYIFDEVVSNVSKVNLVVLSSYSGFGSDIEVREVAFTGSATDIVSTPEPGSIISLLILGTANLGYCLIC